MKKLLFVLLVILPMVACAQIIAFDRTRDGGRIVCTDEVRATGFTEKVKQWYCVSGFTFGDKTTYSIGVKTNWNEPFCIEKGMKLLLRNMNNEVITLVAESTLEVSEGTYLSPKATLKVYTGTAYYSVSPEDMAKVAVGIKKVRIETTSDPVDKEFGSDKIGKFLSKGYQLVRKSLETKKADITDGF